MMLDKSSLGLMILIMISSLAIGYGIGATPEKHELDYRYETPDREIHNFDPYREFNYTGTVEVGEYTIHFQTPEQNEDLENYTGYAYRGGKKEIWIRTGRSAHEVESTCDHEVFHELFPEFTHPEGKAKFSDPVYKYSDDARIVECDLAVEIALARQ